MEGGLAAEDGDPESGHEAQRWPSHWQDQEQAGPPL